MLARVSEPAVKLWMFRNYSCNWTSLQALTVGIVYNKPENHIDFLLRCLEKLKTEGKETEVMWDSFLPDSSESRVSSAQRDIILSSLPSIT